MKSARAIVRRVESIVSTPSGSPESVAPGIFSNIVCRLGPLHRQQRCQAENRNKDSGTPLRPSSTARRSTQRVGEETSGRRIGRRLKKGGGLTSCDSAQVSDSRSVLGDQPPVTATRKLDAATRMTHDARHGRSSGKPCRKSARSARQRTSVRLRRGVAQGVLPDGPA